MAEMSKVKLIHAEEHGGLDQSEMFYTVPSDCTGPSKEVPYIFFAYTQEE